MASLGAARRVKALSWWEEVIFDLLLFFICEDDMIEHVTVVLEGGREATLSPHNGLTLLKDDEPILFPIEFKVLAAIMAVLVEHKDNFRKG